MDSLSFVKSIKSVVRDSAVNNSIKNIESPPGRKPNEDLVFLSKWYNQLDDVNKIMIKSLLGITADSCVFGLLAVLDGVRIMEDEPEKGDFELYYTNKDVKVRLNAPNDEYLHDIFKSLD